MTSGQTKPVGPQGWTTFTFTAVTPLFSQKTKGGNAGLDACSVTTLLGSLRRVLRSALYGRVSVDVVEEAVARVFGAASEGKADRPSPLAWRMVPGVRVEGAGIKVETLGSPPEGWSGFYDRSAMTYLLGQSLVKTRSVRIDGRKVTEFITARPHIPRDGTWKVQVRIRDSSAGGASALRVALLCLAWLSRYGGLGARTSRGMGAFSSSPERALPAWDSALASVPNWPDDGQSREGCEHFKVFSSCILNELDLEEDASPYPGGARALVDCTITSASQRAADGPSALFYASMALARFRKPLGAIDPRGRTRPKTREWDETVLAKGHRFDVAVLGLPLAFQEPRPGSPTNPYRHEVGLKKVADAEEVLRFPSPLILRPRVATADNEEASWGSLFYKTDLPKALGLFLALDGKHKIVGEGTLRPLTLSLGSTRVVEAYQQLWTEGLTYCLATVKPTEADWTALQTYFRDNLRRLLRDLGRH